MLILRTYALYGRNNRVLGFMLAFAAGVICIVVWSTISSDHNPAADQDSVLPLDIGCATAVPDSESKGQMIAWSAHGLFDCMIFVLTLYKTLRRRRPPDGFNLLTVLMRDGCIYFGVIVILNLGNIFSYALGTTDTRGLFNTTTNIMSSLLISRLMFNIRDPALVAATRGGSRVSAAQWESGVFSTYLESIPVERGS